MKGTGAGGGVVGWGAKVEMVAAAAVREECTSIVAQRWSTERSCEV